MKKEIESLGILNEGDAGNNVIILQNKLKILGFYDASVTGSFDSVTKMAVENFQREYGLKITGIVNYDTWEILFEETPSPFPVTVDSSSRILRVSKPTLRLGDRGEYVKELQNDLKQILFYDGEITGIFDEKTEIAVKVFQTTNKLTSDGIVGVDTWSALEYLYAPLSICDNNTSTSVTYIVEKGDTLYSIAKEYGVSADKIKRLNGLINNNLTIGQVLVIKEGVNNVSTNSSVDNYIVKSGDTLYSIAKRFNTTVDEIKNLNNKNNNILTIGEELIVPSSNSNNQNNSNYIVKRGDTLYSIAKSFNITVDEVKRLNNLSSNTLTIGQVLKIPTTNSYQTYIVKRGDTLYSIARDYGVLVNDIKSLNNLTNNIISVGQELLIPNL